MSEKTMSMAEMHAMLVGMKQQNETLAKKLKASETSSGEAKANVTRCVKVNKGGGLFVSDESMRAFSDKKGKEYKCGINIHAYQLQAFKALLSNKAIIKDVLAVIESGETIQRTA